MCVLPFHIFLHKTPFGYNCKVNTLELTKLNCSPVNGFAGSMLSLVVLAACWEEVLKGAFRLQAVKR